MLLTISIVRRFWKKSHFARFFSIRWLFHDSICAHCDSGPTWAKSCFISQTGHMHRNLMCDFQFSRALPYYRINQKYPKLSPVLSVPGQCAVVGSHEVARPVTWDYKQPVTGQPTYIKQTCVGIRSKHALAKRAKRMQAQSIHITSEVVHWAT